MSFTGPSMASGGKTARRAFDFGKTYVVRPKGKHQATVVWLHGLGDNGSSWSQLLEALPLPNIKWICPTAPTRPVTLFGGFPSTACVIMFICNELNLDLMKLGFDVEELSEDAPDDLEGLDAAATHVANLLSTEPADIKIGIGGFSMGSATALYSGTCFSVGKYANGNPFTANLSAVVGLSGWLPCAKFDFFCLALLSLLFCSMSNSVPVNYYSYISGHWVNSSKERMEQLTVLHLSLLCYVMEKVNF
ncbi:unnamed protein product [Linum tenue]|uniref:Phospholipase/carboxylesterase/thioesterase domain-containing protein n=1 Tax=Linum tenue TaxID=586396 RepID=A0AAV0HW99_9ROSI|nr:unnamed protein product [Linum tenue]